MDEDALAAGVAGGDRRALARAVTLVESARLDHRAAALRLLARLDPARRALRLGLTGTPGVGKSTLIEALGLRLAAAGRSLAVLAVDPSSARTGGSILGDKTRMERLAREPRAFIRPSPAGGEPGGVARRTRETVALMEGAGFDVVVVETVGVGQSEIAVAGMTDVFVLLLAPAGGDELQGVKRGIMEMADLVLVTKADGALAPEAARTAADYAGALRLMAPRPGDPTGFPKARTISAATGEGLDAAWAEVETLARHREASGAARRRRAAEERAFFEEEVRRGLLDRLRGDATLAAAHARLAAEVEAGRRRASEAAAAFLLTAGKALDAGRERS